MRWEQRENTLKFNFFLFDRLVFHWLTQITLAGSNFQSKNRHLSHESTENKLTLQQLWIKTWPQYKDKSCRNDSNSIRSIDDSNKCCMHYLRASRILITCALRKLIQNSFEFDSHFHCHHLKFNTHDIFLEIMQILCDRRHSRRCRCRHRVGAIATTLLLNN